MYDFGYDEELPAGFQDADLQMAEWNREANEMDFQRKKGWCFHSSGMGYRNPPVYPEQELLRPGQWVCTEKCKQVFDGEVLEAEPVLVKKEES